MNENKELSLILSEIKEINKKLDILISYSSYACQYKAYSIGKKKVIMDSNTDIWAENEKYKKIYEEIHGKKSNISKKD